jgi:ribokinase
MISVFGSINVDLVSRVALAPKPGETVLGSDYALIPGGKGANQALSARRAGAEVRLVGAIGDDDLGRSVLAELAAGGVDLTALRRRAGTTGLAIITVDARGENTIVLCPGANAVAEAAAIPPDSIKAGDTLLLQLEVPFQESLAAATAAKAAGARVILSVAPFTALAPEDVEPFDILIMNEHEAADFARHLRLQAKGDEAVVRSLARRLGRTVIATLGPAGAIADDGERMIRVPALKVAVVDTTGAGDTFCGVLAAYLDRGAGLDRAMHLAAVAGSLTCTRAGAQPSFPMRAEIEAAAR